MWEKNKHSPVTVTTCIPFIKVMGQGRKYWRDGQFCK